VRAGARLTWAGVHGPMLGGGRRQPQTPGDITWCHWRHSYGRNVMVGMTKKTSVFPLRLRSSEPRELVRLVAEHDHISQNELIE